MFPPFVDEPTFLASVNRVNKSIMNDMVPFPDQLRRKQSRNRAQIVQTALLHKHSKYILRMLLCITIRTSRSQHTNHTAAILTQAQV